MKTLSSETKIAVKTLAFRQIILYTLYMTDLSKCLEKIQLIYLFGATITHAEDFETETEIGACCKFYYVLDGEYELKIARQTYEAKAGSMFFIPAGIPHSRRYVGDVRHVSQQYMHFNFLSLTEPNLFDYLALPYKIDIGVRADVRKMFNNVFRLAAQTTLSSRFKLTATILNLLGLYIEKSAGSSGFIAETAQVQSENTVILKITKYIKDNIDRQITNEELARIACMQENYFIRFFKKQTGTTPHKFITKIKIDTAMGLLENTDITISHAMEKVGYYDMSHFSRTFKQLHKLSPSEYVKKFRDTNYKSNGIKRN